MLPLAVIIPVHGAIDPVLPLLEALIGPDVAQEDRPAQVIVVDDASPCRVPADALPRGVDLLRREHNGGFGAAVNTGLRAATCPQALVLNSDLIIPHGFARSLLEHSAPWQPAVVGCHINNLDGTSGRSARFTPRISHQVVEWLVPLASQHHRPVIQRAMGNDVDSDAATGVVPVDWVSGAVMLLPVTEVLAIAGFDEGYFMYTEEVDLQLRLRRAGVPTLLDADVVAVHEGGGSSGGETRRRRWLVGARVRYARKHQNVHLLRAGLLSASVVNIVWNTGRRLFGRDVNPVAVFREETSLILTAGKELPR